MVFKIRFGDEYALDNSHSGKVWFLYALGWPLGTLYSLYIIFFSAITYQK